MSLTRNLEPSPSITDASGGWQSLRLLNSYRLFVAVVLLVGFIAAPANLDFGHALPVGFYAAVALYVVLALTFALTLYLRRPALGTQAHVQLYSDILLLAVAVYTSGGIASGLGVLMVVPVAGAGMLLPLRHTLLFAALASLLLLGGELARYVDLGESAGQFPQAALLGAALFVSALLAGALARRGARSAELAERRTRDVRQLSALNERIIQQMEAGILVIDPHGRIVLTNASAWQILGNPASLEGEALATVAPGLARALRDWQESGTAPPGPVQPFPDHTEAAAGLQTQFTDLGELGTLLALEDAAFIEEQLQQLKLASLGRLTASIAHEVRNPLGAISHAGQLLRESPRLEHEDERFLRIILDQCERVNTIVENVLQLSRRREVSAEPLELNAWTREFAERYRHDQALADDRLRVTLYHQSTHVIMDRNHLQQIVTNLCDNALHHGIRDDERPLGIHLRVDRDGGQPILAVEDDGRAIDPELATSMFEPFHSTRHEGTGLGLFLARELCEANRARLRYQNVSDHNCFRINLQPADNGG